MQSSVKALNDCLDRITQGDGELSEFYSLLWRTGVTLGPENFRELIGRALPLAGSVREKAWHQLSEGFLNLTHGSSPTAFECLTESAGLFDEAGDEAGSGAVSALLSVYFKNIGQLEKARSHVQLAIERLADSELYRHFLQIAYYQAGEIHHILKDYDTAVKHFGQGMELSPPPMQARMLNGIGTVHMDKGDLKEALRHFEESLKRIEGTGNHVLESKNHADIGSHHLRAGNLQKALEFHHRSMEMRSASGASAPLISNHMEVAEIHLRLGDNEKALHHARAAESMAAGMNVVLLAYRVQLVLSRIYEAMGDHHAALLCFKRFHEGKEEVQDREAARRIEQMAGHHELELMQQEREIYRLRNVELRSALDEIGQGMRYAGRIQEALLPPVDAVRAAFPDSFVLFMPKDIVSGDFFFLTQKDDRTVLAAADCTGHGVPGALMSMICSEILKESVRSNELPGQMLSALNRSLRESLKQSDGPDASRDGMDIALCDISADRRSIRFSGANRPLWVIREGSDEVEAVPATKKAIGGFTDHGQEFECHEVTLNRGDVFYIFSDGYADSFSGTTDKKLTTRRFRQMLIEMRGMPMSEQGDELRSFINGWMGGTEQIDDILIIGVRV